MSVDALLDEIAGAIVVGEVLGEAIARRFGVTSPPDGLCRLLEAGFRHYSGDRNYRARVELKVLKLAPEHYASIRREVLAREATPEGKRKAVSQQARDEQQRASSALRVKEAWRPIKVALEFYHSWKLSTGKALGDATRADLAAEVEINRQAANGHLQNVAFYEGLSAELSGDATVSTLPLNIAHRIREEAFKS
jgi:hypothetical protein